MNRTELMLFFIFVLLVVDCLLALALILGRPAIVVEPETLGDIVYDMPYGGEISVGDETYVVIPD